MNIQDFNKMKEQQCKISMLTCYDYPSACIVADSDIDCVLVGDSVAMAIHGHPNTLNATIEMMVLHTQAVARGLKKQFLVADLPFLSHKGSRSETIGHVKSLLQAGAHAVKIEGADADTLETIHYLNQSGVPVMGHIGLTPQSIHQLGGFRIQGKSDLQAKALLNQAKQLQAAGCFAFVIECVPWQLAKTMTETVDIPSIGIGAGAHTDGQVLVWHDMLGLQNAFKPKFLKQFTQGREMILEAINQYDQQVKSTQFPALEHAY